MDKPSTAHVSAMQTIITNAVTTVTAYPDSTVACTKQEVKCDGCPVKTTSHICIDPRDPDSLVTTITKTIDCTGRVTQTQFNVAPRNAPGRGVTIVQNAPGRGQSSSNQAPSAPSNPPCSPSFAPTPRIPVSTYNGEPCTLAKDGIPHLHLRPQPSPESAGSSVCKCMPFTFVAAKSGETDLSKVAWAQVVPNDQRPGSAEVDTCACQEKKSEPTELPLCDCPPSVPVAQKSCPIIPEHIHIRSIPCPLQEQNCTLPFAPLCPFPYPQQCISAVYPPTIMHPFFSPPCFPQPAFVHQPICPPSKTYQPRYSHMSCMPCRPWHCSVPRFHIPGNERAGTKKPSQTTQLSQPSQPSPSGQSPPE